MFQVNSDTAPSLRLQHRSRLFTVRVWVEDLGDGRGEWRGKLQCVATGETRYFREWPALLVFLSEMLGANGGDNETVQPTYSA